MKLMDPKLQKVWDSAECLYTGEQLDAGIRVMAEKISTDLADSNPLVLCVMNGGLVTCGQLLPLLDIQLQLDYVHATRYRNKLRGSEMSWPALPQMKLKGRTVLLVDDIHDEGVTLSALREYCIDEQAGDIKIAVLVEKIHQRKHLPVAVDYFAVNVPDRYVFGAGMDYQGYLRNASGIYALAEGEAGNKAKS